MSNLSGSDYIIQRVTAPACHLAGITRVKGGYLFQLLFNRHLSGCICRARQSVVMLNSSFAKEMQDAKEIECNLLPLHYFRASETCPLV